MRVSIGTLIGILAGIGLFLLNIFIKTNDYLIFWDFFSILMVFGGTIAATFIAYKENYVLQALKGLLDIFKHTPVDKKSLFGDVEKVINWGKIAETGTLRELQGKIDEKEYDNPIIKFSMDMVFMNEKSETIKEETENLIEQMYVRDNVKVEILDTMAQFAPAFGMIGTLVGLVILLNNMEDQAALGAGMSMALITTLYGVLFANLLLKPAAKKISQSNDLFRYRNIVLLEGISMLPDKPHPYYIQNRMNSFLNPALHFDIASET